MRYLASGISLRRSALLLGINRRTVEKKLPFLARRCEKKNAKLIASLKNHVHNVQFDDLVTKENSKLKPLSVTMAVDEDRNLILAHRVSIIPAFGHLSKIALHRYGFRKDEHEKGLRGVFEDLKKVVVPEAIFKSDEHTRYPKVVSTFFPLSKHLTFQSEKASVVGQGELKKLVYDPLFAINHTFAMLRANINRLFRKTWCTTKSIERLDDHLKIFVYFYNSVLRGMGPTPIK